MSERDSEAEHLLDGNRKSDPNIAISQASQDDIDTDIKKSVERVRKRTNSITSSVTEEDQQTSF